MVCEKQMALNLVDKLTLLYLILVGGLIIVFGENLPYFHKICTIHLLTILALLIVVLGGRWGITGTVLATFFITGFQEGLRFLPLPSSWGQVIAPIQQMAFGLTLILIVLKRSGTWGKKGRFLAQD